MSFQTIFGRATNSNRLTITVTILFVAFHCSPSSAQDTVSLNVGDNFQAAVDSSGENTVFMIKAGEHRMQQVSAKNGDVFVGEKDANGKLLSTMNGSRLLTDWQQSNGYWVQGGQTQHGTAKGYCVAGYTSCKYPEDFFMDDWFMERVVSLAGVAPGKWYFDYKAQKVYIADDPTGHKMEIGVKAPAISGGNNVTVRDLIIEKYPTTSQQMAVWAALVEGCEIRLNHAGGAGTGSGGTLRNNIVHGNGEIGITAQGGSGLVEGNELWGNSPSIVHSDGYYMGGASKFVNTNGLIVRGNYSHDNNSPGLWSDINNINILYEYNRVENNEYQGIFHEISYDAVIRCNLCRDNGRALLSDSEWVWGGQIQMANSQNTRVYNNIIEVNENFGNAITISLQNRGTTGAYGQWYSKNDSIYDNDVTFGGSHGLMGADADWDRANFWTNGNNHFEHNTYHCTDASVAHWIFGDATVDAYSLPLTFDQFRAKGQEQSGKVDSNVTGPHAFADCSDSIPPADPRAAANRPLRPQTRATLFFDNSKRMLRIATQGQRHIQVAICNGLGETIQRLTALEAQSGWFAVSFAEMKPGIYVIRVVVPGRNYSVRIVRL